MTEINIKEIREEVEDRIPRLHSALYQHCYQTQLGDYFNKRDIHFLRDLPDTIKALLAMIPEWQPIETAPKDGSKVLLFREDWDQAFIGKWKYFEDGDGFYAWELGEYICIGISDGILGYEEDHEEGIMPTHWMLLS